MKTLQIENGSIGLIEVIAKRTEKHKNKITQGKT